MPDRSAAPLQLDASSPTVSPEIAGPVAFGLTGAYGPQWQEPYGTTAGRTLTGAAPNEAFPPATADGNPAMRDALATTFSAGHPGSDHPEMQAVLRGALADGMTQENRAVVNTAALDAAVALNPEALLDIPPDIPRGQLQAWRDLAGKALPAAITDRMASMNTAVKDQAMENFQQRLRSNREFVSVPNPTLWEPLDVRNAAGGVVNMDYYAVRVRMPSGADPAVLLNQIRTDMDRFVDTSKSSFAPYRNVAGNQDNVARWNSANPTGSFVTIDIPGNDGTVAVIDSGRDHWTFATVQSPGDGLHPVSGNRQFGYTDNRDGTVTFYTRGVDRITDSATAAINWSTDQVDGPNGHGVAFNGADALWRSFQQRVASHVRETGGQAQVEAPVFVRPDWSAVGDVLTGRESVDRYLQKARP